LRFAAFADLHLDTVFKWASVDIARRKRNAVRDTLTRIFQSAIEAKVDAILCAGDLFEQRHVTQDTINFVRDTFARARPIRVFVSPGNHDWYGPQSPYVRSAWSDNVHIFTEDKFVPIEIESGLTLWGAAHRVPAATNGFLTSFHVDRPGLNLCLFHGSERLLFGAQAKEKQPYAPFDEEEIVLAGFHHAFVGHIHVPRDAEHHTYPGSPEPLTFGETDCNGLLIAEIDRQGKLSRRRLNVQNMPMSVCEFDVSSYNNSSELREGARKLLNGAKGIVRLILQGSLDPDLDLRIGDLRSAGHPDLIVSPQLGDLDVRWDLNNIRREQTVRGEFVRLVESSEPDFKTRRRVITTGLRALAGRDDLEIPI
jgi:exonuclease SbcD